MNLYEVMTITDPGLEIEATDALLTKVNDAIKKGGGKLGHVDKWGRKKLAYEIRGFNDGVYAVTKFEGDPSTIGELDHFLKINDQVLRHVVIRLPEPKKV